MVVSAGCASCTETGSPTLAGLCGMVLIVLAEPVSSVVLRYTLYVLMTAPGGIEFGMFTWLKVNSNPTGVVVNDSTIEGAGGFGIIVCLVLALGVALELDP